MGRVSWVMEVEPHCHVRPPYGRGDGRGEAGDPEQEENALPWLGQELRTTVASRICEWPRLTAVRALEPRSCSRREQGSASPLNELGVAAL